MSLIIAKKVKKAGRSNWRQPFLPLKVYFFSITFFEDPSEYLMM